LVTLTKIPAWLQVYNKDICWKMAEVNKTLYLTFDDGPHPVATPLVLDLLKQYGIKATFFCIGENVEQYPELYQQILDDGHQTGNHSYSHRSGWKIPVDEYVADVTKAAALISSKLFRPPYGRITPLQFKVLKHQYKIVMWDVLSKDYDDVTSDEQVIHNVTDHVSPGSIIVMHDNDKTMMRAQGILSCVLDRLMKDNWTFQTL
jgi:peptidoglycan/xylan/chitin deacetylase (PgdA/CDA1 family)